MKWTLKTLALVKGRVLDFGCGKGELIEEAHLTKENYVGITSSIKEYCFAKPHYIIELRCYPEDDDMVHHSYFDTIFCSHVLEHFTKEELDKTMRLLYDRLNRDGRFVAITPTEYHPFFYAEHTHVRPYNHEALSNLLKEAGYKDVEWFYPRLSWLPCVLQKWLRFPLFFLKPWLWNEVVATGVKR